MPRPATEAAYLATFTPPSVAATAALTRRRTVLKAALTGAGLLGTPGLLAGCGSGDDLAAGTDVVSFGSNQSDDIPRRAFEEMVARFDHPGITIRTNVIDHNTFQENISNYLQGQPSDVFTWFAGFRMQFFAEQGLVGDISEVWRDMTGISESLRQISTGRDGRQYFVPFYYYPWAVFYRPSVFRERGYSVPSTMNEFVTLADRMRADGLIPLAFADKDGWPAMGTFDQLNLRLNGYDFHLSLMSGREAWDGPQVRRVFELWRDLLPYHQADPLGRTWQEAAQTLQQRKAGMMVFGMFVGQQFTAGADRDDLDFFNFPEIDPAIGADAVEAPVDGFMMRATPRNRSGALEFLRYLARPAAQLIYTTADTTVVAANAETDTSGYTALQRKAVDFVAGAKSIAQFMDRDTRPDFASTVLLPSLQQFLSDPVRLDGLLRSIEEQKKTIFEL